MSISLLEIVPRTQNHTIASVISLFGALVTSSLAETPAQPGLANELAQQIEATSGDISQRRNLSNAWIQALQDPTMASQQGEYYQALSLLGAENAYDAMKTAPATSQLRYAENLAASGNANRASSVCMRVYKAHENSDPADTDLLCHALTIWAQCLGKRAQSGLVDKLNTSQHPEVRQCIVRILSPSRNPALASELVALSKQKNCQCLPEIYTILGNVGGAESEKILLRASQELDINITPAAISALGAIAPGKHLQPLVKIYVTGSLESKEAARKVLVDLPDENVSRNLGMMLERASTLEQVAAILNLLGERKATSEAPTIARFLQDKHPYVRNAAQKAAAEAATPEILPEVKRAIENTEDEAELKLLYLAVQTGLRNADPLHPREVSPEE